MNEWTETAESDLRVQIPASSGLKPLKLLLPRKWYQKTNLLGVRGAQARLVASWLKLCSQKHLVKARGSGPAVASPGFGCTTISKSAMRRIAARRQLSRGAAWWCLGAVPHLSIPESLSPPTSQPPAGGPAHICCWSSHLQWITGLAPA